MKWKKQFEYKDNDNFESTQNIILIFSNRKRGRRIEFVNIITILCTEHSITTIFFI